jgi:hypothetical protein
MRNLFQPAFYRCPVDVLEEGIDIVCPPEAIVNHESVLKNIEDQ